MWPNGDSLELHILEALPSAFAASYKFARGARAGVVFPKHLCPHNEVSQGEEAAAAAAARRKQREEDERESLRAGIEAMEKEFDHRNRLREMAQERRCKCFPLLSFRNPLSRCDACEPSWKVLEAEAQAQAQAETEEEGEGAGEQEGEEEGEECANESDPEICEDGPEHEHEKDGEESTDGILAGLYEVECASGVPHFRDPV